MLLQDIETCRQARLILRELIKGDKSRAQLWGSLVDNQLDDVDLRFLLPPLANEGYIEESKSMWHILDKGVKYMQNYDKMMLESAEGYLEGRLKDTSENPQERKQESERRWNRKMTVIGVILALLSVLAAYTEPLLERAWQAILSLVIDK
ncbi:MAG: hypothetical protein EGR34_06535 [Prevotella sp.]|nr:hypothetical protein [Prevotella sp.]